MRAALLVALTIAVAFFLVDLLITPSWSKGAFVIMAAITVIGLWREHRNPPAPPAAGPVVDPAYVATIAAMYPDSTVDAVRALRATHPGLGLRSAAVLIRTARETGPSAGQAQ